MKARSWQLRIWTAQWEQVFSNLFEELAGIADFTFKESRIQLITPYFASVFPEFETRFWWIQERALFRIFDFGLESKGRDFE